MRFGRDGHVVLLLVWCGHGPTCLGRRRPGVRRSVAEGMNRRFATSEHFVNGGEPAQGATAGPPRRHDGGDRAGRRRGRRDHSVADREWQTVTHDASGIAATDGPRNRAALSASRSGEGVMGKAAGETVAKADERAEDKFEATNVRRLERRNRRTAAPRLRSRARTVVSRSCRRSSTGAVGGSRSRLAPRGAKVRLEPPRPSIALRARSPASWRRRRACCRLRPLRGGRRLDREGIVGVPRARRAAAPGSVPPAWPARPPRAPRPAKGSAPCRSRSAGATRASSGAGRSAAPRTRRSTAAARHRGLLTVPRRRRRSSPPSTSVHSVHSSCPVGGHRLDHSPTSPSSSGSATPSETHGAIPGALRPSWVPELCPLSGLARVSRRTARPSSGRSRSGRRDARPSWRPCSAPRAFPSTSRHDERACSLLGRPAAARFDRSAGSSTSGGRHGDRHRRAAPGASGALAAGCATIIRRCVANEPPDARRGRGPRVERDPGSRRAGGLTARGSRSRDRVEHWSRCPRPGATAS